MSENRILLGNNARFDELMMRLRATGIGRAISASEWEEVEQFLLETMPSQNIRSFKGKMDDVARAGEDLCLASESMMKERYCVESWFGSERRSQLWQNLENATHRWRAQRQVRPNVAIL